MAVRQAYGGSYWVATVPATAYPTLAGRVEVDVAIVGAGIVGITTAWILKRAGFTVALIEARRAAAQVTGGTTAKVTSLHGDIYGRLLAKYGEPTARVYGASNQAALEWIATTVASEKIDCEFERKDAWLYTEHENQAGRLSKETAIAQQLGLPAEFVESVSLPFTTAGAMRFANQAQFHPVKYLHALLAAIPGDGSHVFENSRVVEVDEKNILLQTSGGRVRASNVVIATNLPFLNRGGYFATTAPYGDAVLAARLNFAAHGAHLNGMFISLDEPSRTVRSAEQGKLLIFSGETYKTGQADTLDCMSALEDWARAHFPIEQVEYRWTNEDFESADSLPFIGNSTGATPSIWVATGFSGWGMTTGTVAAQLLADRIRKIPNPWTDVYDSRRWHPMAAAPKFIKENLNVAGEWLRDHLLPGELRPAEQLARGEATVLQSGAGKVAAHRDDAGQLHLVSASCTHMHCIVSWNGVDRTWDCPCHGSRFSVDGEIICGPALANLNKIQRDRM